MKFYHERRCVFTLIISLVMGMIAYTQKAKSVFDDSKDIGNMRLRGRTDFIPGNQEYIISGSGSNIWGTQDEFHFAYSKIDGDFILQSQTTFQGEGVDPHRKTGWMFRTSLDSSSAMVAVSIHGDGLTSLQYRETDGSEVKEIKSTVRNADVLQLERRGNKFVMSVAVFGETFTSAEITLPGLDLSGYAGIFLCSHNSDVIEVATARNVRIIKPAKENFVPYRDYIGSHIEELEIESGSRKIMYSENRSLQAPNYIDSGRKILYNSEGRIYVLNPSENVAEVLNTGDVRANNNDHVISFDGNMLGLSSASGEAEDGSLVYLVPVGGGQPQRITARGPSYLHGFSPDGKWMTYTGGRNNNFDIFKINVNGGEEIRLTSSSALDDGSEYSPDGKYIYFNSARTGKMQVWRMKPDGSNQEQITDDNYNNWFPHISPDGKWMVFLSYGPEVKADDHPFYKNVYLRMMQPDGNKKTSVIAYLYGGQGSINTGSWSPDSKRIAFVSNSDEIK